MALTNAQYEAIIRGYEQTQDENRHLLERRREEVYAQVPGYQELESSVGTLSVSMARRMLLEDEAAVNNLREQLALLRNQREQLLLHAGYPADYLSPIYRCEDCKDTGYLLTEAGVKEKCHCFRKQELSILYDQSNIQEMTSRENFSSLSYAYYQGEDLQRFRSAVELCRNFIQNFSQDYRNLFFYGTVGTGKSFLSGCVARELLDAGHSVIYFSASGLFDALARYSFDSKSKEKLHKLYEDLYNCDLLIIDDLGTELTNNFVTSQLFSCLNERSLRRKSLIISTNLGLEELRDRYSDRIFSRISTGFSLCKLTGPDIRIQKKLQMKNDKERT